MIRSVALVLGLSAASPALAEWVSVWELDKLDGSPVVAYVRHSTEARIVPQRQPEKTVVAHFMIVCRKGGANFRIGVERELVAGHAARVDYRMGDRGPVRDRQWQTSADSTSVGSWSSAPTWSFLKAAAESPSLFVRVKDDVFGLSEFTFNTSDLKEQLSRLPKECGKPR